ncbi:organic cation transporter protein-like [Diorhabda sublineata]|uniref:organic cation transporter protein-like n=1 Tax=Diorhabda sublineata TaxID=1163346 RepID=UPI0024E1059D|nr:organic cation transporter protein-like [Diorhabda sublineata]
MAELSKDHTLDDVLMKTGDFGKYQIVVFAVVNVAVMLHSAVHNAFVFTALNVNYRCAIPECDLNSTVFEPTWLSVAVPYNGRYPEKCKKFFNTNDRFDSCTPDTFDRNRQINCSSFIYETTEYSILHEYNLQCEENLWKLSMVGTVNNIGQFVGLFIGGFISDRYGRKFLLVWGMLLCAVFGLSRTFMPTYELFLLFEFLDAAFSAGTYICGFVLGVELVGPKKRVITGIISSSTYAVGEMFTASAAWSVQSWKKIIYILYTPIFLLISYIWIVPESVRWLLSKGRTEEAKSILRKAAKWNGKHLPEEVLEKLSYIDASETTKKNEILNALKSRILCVRLIICSFCWIVCAFQFYGLTLNSVTLVHGNSYLDFMLTALIEIPAYISCRYILDIFGRKKSLCGSYLITGVATAGYLIIPEDSRAGSLAIYLLGKYGVTCAFTILYVHTSEMFPTNLRHTFMGTCSTLGRIGSMVSPQTPLLAQIWKPLPFIIFTVTAWLAALLTLTFPETSNIKLPDTVEQAEKILKLKRRIED